MCVHSSSLPHTHTKRGARSHDPYRGPHASLSMRASTGDKLNEPWREAERERDAWSEEGQEIGEKYSNPVYIRIPRIYRV